MKSNDVFKEFNVFSSSKLNNVLYLYFTSINKLKKLQYKLNNACKCILQGKSISPAILKLNDEIHIMINTIKNCLNYLFCFNETGDLIA